MTMYAFYLFSVWLHILAATVWIGGMVFLALVLVPVTRHREYRDIAASLIQQSGVRFRWVGWGSLGLLLLTGIFNLGFRGFSWGDIWSGELLSGSFGRILGMKLLLVVIILILSIWHDFFIGPRATALSQADPTSPEAGRLRRQASWLGRFNLLLGLVVVALAIKLVR